MEQIKISSKNLGSLAMPDFCPRCAWIKMKASKLPWQIFPGIFSSIDAYTKKCVHEMIKSRAVPRWLSCMGNIIGFEKVSSRAQYHDITTNIILTGVPDNLFVCVDGTKIIPDYKTAKFTANQDKLFPMYEAQVNGYAFIHYPKAKLFLVYMEPQTDDICLGSENERFALDFRPYVVAVENKPEIIFRLFSIAREIYECKKSPAPVTGCKDCEALGEIGYLLRST